MPCNHKFRKYLNLERLDFEPEVLIVGSFDPEWPNNSAEWFYGRTQENCFWDVLPRLYGSASLIDASPAEWKQFCHDKRIAITALISGIEEAEQGNKEHNKILAGFSDKAVVYHFDDFEYVNIVQLLQQRPTIKSVYLTRGATEAFWKHLWGPVAHYCNHHGVHERTLMVPTSESAYHHTAHNTDHPDDVVERMEDYILRRWEMEWQF